jgi:hypothetical protein
MPGYALIVNWRDLARELEPRSVVHARVEPTTTRGLPEPVQRYFAAAIAPGTVLAPAVRLRIRGEIRLGGRWLPFRSQEVLDPTRGLVWWGTVARIVSGGDGARIGDGAGEGRLEWRLLGVKRVAFAQGEDVARSGLARAFAEACLWAPTAVLAAGDVSWAAPSDREIVASRATPYDTVVHRMTLDDDHRVVAGVFDRWGDPDGTGASALHPFGGEVNGWSTFGGVTIASRGSVGWGFATERWPAGEFFRYEVVDAALLDGRRAARRS